MPHNAGRPSVNDEFLAAQELVHHAQSLLREANIALEVAMTKNLRQTKRPRITEVA
jgi:hypothetical protein